MDICGIYKIENLINHKKYIGQSINVKIRFMGHKSDLKHNRHVNSYLQAAYNKYGKECFEFEIIEECDVTKLDEREQYWIQYYDSCNSDYGYNLTNGGQFNKIVPAQEVVCLTTGESFCSTRQAAEHYNLSVSGINSCIKNRIRYCGWSESGAPLVWKYAEQASKLSDTQKQGMIDHALTPIKSKRQHCVICLNTMEIFDSITKASQKYNVSSASIVGCCTGKCMSAGQLEGVYLIWMYYEDYLSNPLSADEFSQSAVRSIGKSYKKVALLNTGEVFNSIIEASYVYNVGKTSISGCCRRKSRTAGKDEKGNRLVWMYYTQYQAMSQGEIQQHLIWAQNENWQHHNDRSVVLINTGEHFNSLSDAERKYGVSVTNISANCKGKSSHAGLFSEGQPLIWMYDEEYEVVTAEELINKFNAVEDAYEKKYNHNARRVVLLNTLQVFDRIVDAANQFKITAQTIRGCCTDKQYYGGIDNENNKLVWRYYEDYIHMADWEINQALNLANDPFSRSTYKKSCKEIICTTTNECFPSIRAAADYYNLKSSNISRVLAISDKMASAGKHPVTGEKLYWKYKTV